MSNELIFLFEEKLTFVLIFDFCGGYRLIRAVWEVKKGLELARSSKSFKIFSQNIVLD